MSILEADNVKQLERELDGRPIPTIENVETEINWLRNAKEKLNKSDLEADLQEIVAKYFHIRADRTGISGLFEIGQARRELNIAQKNFHRAMELAKRIDTYIEDLEVAKLCYAKEFPYLVKGENPIIKGDAPAKNEESTAEREFI